MKNFILICIIVIVSPVFSLDINSKINQNIWDNVKKEKIKKYNPKNRIVIEKIYDLYQTKVSDKSIHRCPFYTSCSRFYSIALREYGCLWGSIMFIDRYFYRENKAAYKYYDFKSRDDGVLKLDDDYFLYGK